MGEKTLSIVVKETQISVILGQKEDDYINITDMTKNFEGGSKLIEKWLNTKSTIDYLGVWELLNNPNFNSPEFGGIKMEAGSNKFYMSVQRFIERTNAIGIKAKAGRYGGTYAHKDIAFHFAMWLSPEFNLLIIKEIQLLKERENNVLAVEWDAKRALTKINYSLHTDAVRDFIIPQLSLPKLRERYIYATEADVLNLALFGYTAKDWEKANPDLVKAGKNMRDTATINQLIVMTNLESFNAELIKQKVSIQDRLDFLHRVAKEQLSALDKSNAEQRFRRLVDNANNPKAIE